MFLFDKDMERVMLAKKKEVLRDIEEAKKRVLHELYCLKRSAHSDLCSLQADYNRIQITLAKTIEEIRAELGRITADYKGMIETTFNHYTEIVDNKLLALETFEREVVQEVNEKLSELEGMKTQVETLIEELEKLDFSEELDNLADELRQEMEPLKVQGDWHELDETSRAFIKNKTHYYINRGDPIGNMKGSMAVPSVSGALSQSLLPKACHMSDFNVGMMLRLTLYSDPEYTNRISSVSAILDKAPSSSAPMLVGGNDDLSVEIMGSRGDYDSAVKDYYCSIYFNFGYTQAFCSAHAGERFYWRLESAVEKMKYLEPFYLAPYGEKGMYLRHNGEDSMEWTTDLCLISENGSVFKLVVSNDGTLSTVAVTN